MKPNFVYYEIHANTVDENIDTMAEINVMCTDKEVAHDITEMLLLRGYDAISLDVIGTMEKLVL